MEGIMVWTRLDDGWNRHPKILGLSRNARLLWVDGLTYCNEQLTDGFIPRCAVVAMLGGVGFKSHSTTIGELCKRDLWRFDDVRDGYWVHDFLEYNPSRSIVVARRENEAKRKANARAAKAMSRRDTPRESHGESRRESRRESQRESHGESRRESALPDPTRPDPPPSEDSPVCPPSGEEGPTNPSKPAKERAKKNATQMPADWQPTESNIALARELGRDLRLEADKFRDYCHAHGKTYTEWGAAFGNWLRNERYRNPTGAKNGSERPRGAYPVQSSGRGFQAVLDCAPPKREETGDELNPPF